MLSKLIKHEFRATSRIMWPVFLGMLALTALMRFSQLLLNGGHIPWLLQLIGVLLVIGFVMGLFALAFAPLVLSAVRWRDHVLKDEGYLTLTLPVSLHQLLISKLIAHRFRRVVCCGVHRGTSLAADCCLRLEHSPVCPRFFQ